MTVAAAAAPSSSEAGEEETFEGGQRLLGYGKKLRARLDTPGFKGTLTVRKAWGKNKFKWVWRVTKMDDAKFKVDGNESKDLVLDPDACREGLKWHIHAKKVTSNGDCGGATTGSHWDPTFACGGKSEYQDPNGTNGICDKILADTTASRPSYGERCSEATPKGCEYGDLNGKMGFLPREKTRYRGFTDVHLPPLEEFEGRSIVVHCGSPRVACGNFQ